MEMEWNPRVCFSVLGRSPHCSRRSSCSVFRRQERKESGLNDCISQAESSNPCHKTSPLPSSPQKNTPQESHHRWCGGTQVGVRTQQNITQVTDGARKTQARNLLSTGMVGFQPEGGREQQWNRYVTPEPAAPACQTEPLGEDKAPRDTDRCHALAPLEAQRCSLYHIGHNQIKMAEAT